MKVNLIELDIEHKHVNAASGQSHYNTSFAFCTKKSNENYEQQHIFFRCRDIMFKIPVADREKTKTQYYNTLTYNGKQEPLDHDKLRLLVRWNVYSNTKNYKLPMPSPWSDNTVEKIKKALTVVDEFLGLELPKITAVNDSVFLLESDAKWLNCGPTLHLYTSFIRTVAEKNLTPPTKSKTSVASFLGHQYSHEGMLPAILLSDLPELLSVEFTTFDGTKKGTGGGSFSGMYYYGNMFRYCQYITHYTKYAEVAKERGDLGSAKTHLNQVEEYKKVLLKNEISAYFMKRYVES